jgi:RNA polymerase sigma factor (sigma-70 family)
MKQINKQPVDKQPVIRLHELTDGKYEVIDWMNLVDRITKKLRKKFNWIERDELFSVALLSVAEAEVTYKSHLGVSMNSYLYTKGFFKAIDRMRHEGLIFRGDSDSAKSIGEAKTYNNFDRVRDGQIDGFFWEELRERIENKMLSIDDDILEDLNESDKNLITMYYNGTQSTDEIGHHMGLTVRSVNKRMSRARKRIEKFMLLEDSQTNLTRS